MLAAPIRTAGSTPATARTLEELAESRGAATVTAKTETVPLVNNGSSVNAICYQTLITSSQPFVATSANNGS